jgi:hypothetical protein
VALAHALRSALLLPGRATPLAFPSPVEGVGIVGLPYIVKRGLWPTQMAAGITKVGKDSNGKVTNIQNLAIWFIE